MIRGASTGAMPRCSSLPELLHVLGRAETYDLIRVLARGPARTGELTEALELEYSAISGKLSILKAAGLVQYKRIKKFHVYSLTNMVEVERNDSTLQLTVSLPSGERMTLHLSAASNNGKMFLE